MPSTNTKVAARILDEKARRIVQKLRKYHRRGCQAWKSSAVSTTYWMSRWNVSESTVRKIRAFAKGYTTRDLKLLCALKRANGLPFHWGYVGCFLTVGDRNRRSEMQRQAAAENWSVAELQAAVLNSRDTTGNAGRPLKSIANRLRALKRITLDLHGLNRRLQQACDKWESLKNLKRSREKIGDELANIDGRLNQARETFAQLQCKTIGKKPTRRHH